ncbi:trimeric intracellular cation channel family protein [Variovorax sp. LT1R16]|uniref:trimeric intracellular cation channel family protein n=1 Tax=Variovorax sp. LT1R16 TaxID=3443728 RepID=UPI003F458DC4
MLLYFFDLAGVAVFAISGVLAAGHAGLDWLGVVVIASVTAVGGGTLRDLLLDRHPVFWIRDVRYVYAILGATAVGIAWVHFGPLPEHALALADAVGLGLFAITGAQIAEEQRLPAVVVTLIGTMTGAAGGLLRDVFTAHVPLLLSSGIYGSAAIVGIAAYLLLQAAGTSRRWAFHAGVVLIVMLRLGGIYEGWHLPVLRLPT